MRLPGIRQVKIPLGQYRDGSHRKDAPQVTTYSQNLTLLARTIPFVFLLLVIFQQFSILIFCLDRTFYFSCVVWSVSAVVHEFRNFVAPEMQKSYFRKNHLEEKALERTKNIYLDNFTVFNIWCGKTVR